MPAYICGPLTELKVERQAGVKELYVQLGNLCELLFGERAFVPHEHYDPVANPNPSPQEVDAFERRQVCERTDLLVVVALEPSWGGGIEVEMAYRSEVPVIILVEQGKRISRLLRGNPAVRAIVEFLGHADALVQFEARARELFPASTRKRSAAWSLPSPAQAQ